MRMLIFDRHIAPLPNMQRPRLKMLQPRRTGIDLRVIDILDHLPKPHPRPALAIEQRQLGSVGIGFEVGGRWKRGSHTFQVSSRGSNTNGSGLPMLIFLKSGCAGLIK